MPSGRLGALVRMPAEPLVELAGLAGLDVVVLDTEHGPLDGLAQHLLAARAVGASALVRVGGTGHVEIQRALDAGAHGVVVPHVDDAAAARAAVAAARYPPAGRRGFAGYTRAADYGLIDTAAYLARAAHTAVVVMVEDVDGVAAAAEILGVDGVDGVLVGPADLAVALGVPGETGHPSVREATATVHAAARAAGVAVVAIVGSAQGARAAFAEGADLVLINVQAVLGAAFTDLAATRPDSGPRPSAPADAD